MGIVRINKQFVDEIKPVLEENSGELITEQAGYIPPQRQIENMILAGQRLADSRQNYDFDDEIDEEAWDPTRTPNFDMADATQLRMQAEARLAEARLKESQKAQDARIAKEKQFEDIMINKYNVPLPQPKFLSDEQLDKFLNDEKLPKIT